jgi:hypothetical protein
MSKMSVGKIERKLAKAITLNASMVEACRLCEDSNAEFDYQCFEFFKSAAKATAINIMLLEQKLEEWKEREVDERTFIVDSAKAYMDVFKRKGKKT